MQVNLTVNIRDDFCVVVQWPLYTGRPPYTGPLHTGSTVVWTVGLAEEIVGAEFSNFFGVALEISPI